MSSSRLGTPQHPIERPAPSGETRPSGRDARGRFIAGHPGPRLETGQHSQLVRDGICGDRVEALARARHELRDQLGDVGIVKGALADAFVELDAVRVYLGERLRAEGPLTAKGRTRALLSAYLSTADRQVRLAQLLGLAIRPRELSLSQTILATPEVQP